MIPIIVRLVLIFSQKHFVLIRYYMKALTALQVAF